MNSSSRKSFLVRLSSPAIKILLFSFLLFFILLPSSFVLVYLIKQRGNVLELINQTATLGVIINALLFSLKIASFVSIVDLLFGIPFAWLLTRTNLKRSRFFENLASLPLALPTSALGFSAATFWALTRLPLSSFWFISLVHFSFTFPFVVGVIGTALKKNTKSLEQAALVLGAPKITIARTVVLPLIKLEIITAFLFSFARSLSETGATIVALEVFGANQPTAPALIAQFSKTVSQQSNDERMLLAAVISGVLIIISLSLFSLLRVLTKSSEFPIIPKLVSFEKQVGKPSIFRLSNFLLFAFLFGVVLIPAFYILVYAPQVQRLHIQLLAKGLMSSFLIALSVTVINLIIGTPTAYFLVHSSSTVFRKIMNFLVDIPLIVPTVALGFSLGLYWKSQGIITSDFILIIFAHIAFTYPYVVRTLHDAFAGLSNEFIEASRSLGAKPFKVFKTVSLPLLAPAFSTAVVLVLARSLGETGATMAVSDKVLTAPVYIVDFVKSQQFEQAGIASAILIMISFVIFTLLRQLAYVRNHR